MQTLLTDSDNGARDGLFPPYTPMARRRPTPVRATSRNMKSDPYRMRRDEYVEDPLVTMGV